MNERNRPSWFEIVGTLLIVASLCLVLVQIRQNTHAISSQAVAELNGQADESHLAVATDPQLADLILRARADLAALPAVDQLRLESFIHAQFNRQELAYSYHQRGIYDDADYASWQATLCEWINRKPHSAYWSKLRPSFNPEFVKTSEARCLRR
jgi:hypothetical protein